MDCQAPRTVTPLPSGLDVASTVNGENMQNIHVKRYSSQQAGYAGTVEPEDRSWILFIDLDGAAKLWVRQSVESSDGKTESEYVPA